MELSYEELVKMVSELQAKVEWQAQIIRDINQDRKQLIGDAEYYQKDIKAKLDEMIQSCKDQIKKEKE